ncbi:MAG TPA: TerB family tellurite resistance protein, partial [Afifellaceae bacterium]|nr:TerB family tellurite resistance protein [Afifellaceae bacterium]
AALLVHCMAVDGTAGPAEEQKLRAVLRHDYGLSDSDLRSLIEDAHSADQEAVDLYRFTSVLSRNLDREGRIRIVKRLWDMVYADGTVHEFEDNLVWRLAELLGVEREQRLTIKADVARGAG